MLLAALFSLTSANAAGLDLLEVGGAWGTPGATNPTAIWWNPAGLAVGGGTQFIVEGAPLLANVYADRANPDYGDVTYNMDGDESDLSSLGYPSTYDYSGRADVKVGQVVPFVGVSSDFTIKGLGVGLGLAVPTATGGEVENPDGPLSYHLRSGDIKAPQVILAASYRIKELVSLGVSGNYVDSTWGSVVDTSTYPDLSFAVMEEFNAERPLNSFRDGYIEDKAYGTIADFDKLHDTAFTFGAGIYVTPIEQLGISVAFNKGVSLEHEGDLTLTFACPPEYDGLARFAATSRGLCYGDTGEGAVMKGTGVVGYSLPSRVNMGVVVFPVEKVRLEAMGSWVGWKVFSDYDIKTIIADDQLNPAIKDTEVRAETIELVNKPRLWARDNRNTFWAGVDGKAQVHDMLMVGGRVFYDKASVPTESLLLNNLSLDTLGLSAMAMFSPLEQLGLGLSYARYQMFSKTVTNSNFGLTVDPDLVREFRYQFPGGNGTYGGSINRFGISLRGQFGKKGVMW